LGGAISDLTPSIWDGIVDLFWGVNAALALGGAISELTYSIWDGSVDLFGGLDAGLVLGGATLDLILFYRIGEWTCFGAWMLDLFGWE